MSRYIPNTDQDKKLILSEIGVSEIDEIFSDIPKEVRLGRDLKIPTALSEMELIAHMKELAAKNKNTEEYTCFLGAGAYDHFIPSIIPELLKRQEFYTAYTPYQPEISQGTLQAIFEYQTMICELTGMDVSNASLYDGATSIAEAMSMATQSTRRGEIIVARSVHPDSREVLNTYARFKGYSIKEVGYKNGQVDLEALEAAISNETAAVVVQSPNFFGVIENLKDIADVSHKNKALLIASVNPISLGILKSPGELGVDIAVGEGQSLGNPLSFGGPYLGFLATKNEFLRKMPGRIVGETTDKNGKRGFVLTIQAREQHIRREKATSNICSNQALNALTACIYMSTLGKTGIKAVAELCVSKAHYAYNELIKENKFKPVFSAPFFNEFVVESNTPVKELNSLLLQNKIIGGYDVETLYPELKNTWLLAMTEKRSKAEIDLLVGRVLSL